ncbi:substrate-binding domain-containing protein, partial [Rhodococcus jostii]|uniref:substrate-binding domain-containing protein n=1 Tax=Rhodococcus jostii TaxID=132919 RepID=UPI00364AD4B4
MCGGVEGCGCRCAAAHHGHAQWQCDRQSNCGGGTPGPSACSRRTPNSHELVFPPLDPSRAAAAATRLLGRGVTGIVCGSDPLALGAIRAARRRGLSVPADVSVVGFDDSAFMTVTEPPLSTVRQPIEAMGRAAVDLL